MGVAMWSLQAVKLGCLLGLALLPLLLGLLPAAILRLRGALGDGRWARGSCAGGPSAGSFIHSFLPPSSLPDASRPWRSILTCAAGGVFLAACLLDVVPDSLEDLREELSRQNLSVPSKRGEVGRGGRPGWERKGPRETGRTGR